MTDSLRLRRELESRRHRLRHLGYIAADYKYDSGYVLLRLRGVCAMCGWKGSIREAVDLDRGDHRQRAEADVLNHLAQIHRVNP